MYWIRDEESHCWLIDIIKDQGRSFFSKSCSLWWWLPFDDLTPNPSSFNQDNSFSRWPCIIVYPTTNLDIWTQCEHSDIRSHNLSNKCSLHVCSASVVSHADITLGVARGGEGGVGWWGWMGIWSGFCWKALLILRWMTKAWVHQSLNQAIIDDPGQYYYYCCCWLIIWWWWWWWW